MPDDPTWVAIATPPGTGGIGIVRLSGPKALSIGQALFSTPLRTPRRLEYGIFSIEDVRLDQGCAVYFKAPHSYTGEDVVECHMHGSPYILNTLVQGCVNLGAQMAGPGTFTRQAFINGRLDLTQAESVVDLIESTSKASHHVALDHVQGKLFATLSDLRQNAMTLLEQIEASIDFPDEVQGLDRKAATLQLKRHQALFAKMIALEDFGRFVKEGVRVLILGRPNVGKSSLLNQLLGESRVIVSDTPGTTRDYIESSIHLGQMVFHFMDTAGIRTSLDAIERQGIAYAKPLIQRADYVFWVLDASEKFNEDDRKVQALLEGKSNVILLYNKTDLKSESMPIDPTRYKAMFALSAKTGDGLEALKQGFYDVVTGDGLQQLDLLCNARQLHCVKRAHSILGQLIGGLHSDYEDDMLAQELRQLILILGEATGDDVTEEMLDGIFSRFCIGK